MPTSPYSETSSLIHSISSSDSSTQQTPDAAQSSVKKLYYALIYRLFRDDPMKRLCWLPFARLKFDDSTQEPSRFIWPSAQALPLTKPAAPILLQAALDGLRFSAAVVWPTAFSALLAYDFYRYFSLPDERYGNTWKNILLGTAPSQYTLSTHFGSGILKESRDYWLWLSLTLAPPVLVTLGSVVSQLPWLRPLDNVDAVSRTLQAPPNFWRDTLGVFQHWFNLSRAEQAILWQRPLSNDDREQLVQSIIHFAEQQGGLLQFRAIQALAQIADNFKPAQVARYRKKYAGNLRPGQLTTNANLYMLNYDPEPSGATGSQAQPISEQTATVDDTEQPTVADTFHNKQVIDFFNSLELSANNALTALKRLANEGTVLSLGRRTYAHYQLWTLGQEERAGFHVIFAPLMPVKLVLSPLLFSYVLYTQLRWGGAWVQKFLTLLNNFQAAQICEANGKVWQFDTAQGNYDCTFCSDWDFVPFSQINSTQGCLDGLLAKPRNASELLAYADRLFKLADVTVLDMSQQDWPNWTDSEWDGWLARLENATVPQLSLFNLSRQAPALTAPTTGKIRRLATFLANKPVQQLALQNQRLGLVNFQTLLQATHRDLTYLDGSGNALDSESGVAIGKWLAQTHAVLTVKLAGNKLANLGIQDIASYLSNSTLESLDASANDFSEAGAEALIAAASSGQLRELIVSGNDLSTVNMQQWAMHLSQSQIRRLGLAKTNLEGDQLLSWSPYLAKSSLEKLDLGDNDLADQGAIALILGSRNSSLLHVRLANNQITNRAMPSFLKALNQTQLECLDISNNDITVQGLLQLILGAHEASLTTLNAAEIMLSDEDVLQLASVLEITRHRIIDFDFSSCRLSSQAGITLIRALPKNTRRLVFRNNNFDDAFAQAFANFMSNSSLVEVDLSANDIGPDGGAAVVAHISHAKNLTRLILSDNPIGDEVGLMLAQTLISSGPYSKNLGNAALNYDERRAIAAVEAQTNMMQLELENCGLGNQAVRALCRVQPRTLIRINSLRISNNPFDAVDRLTCRPLSVDNMHATAIFNTRHNIMPTRHAESSVNYAALLLSLVPLLGGIALLYLVYRFITSRCSSNTESTQDSAQSGYQRSGLFRTSTLASAEKNQQIPSISYTL